MPKWRPKSRVLTQKIITESCSDGEKIRQNNSNEPTDEIYQDGILTI